MHDGWTMTAAFCGGCQCGAVRFAVAAGAAKSSVCHCRMCQRASGNAFAPLIEVRLADTTLAGPVGRWASSNLAERGFCGQCGTPLFYRHLGGDTIEFMIGAIDAPFAYAPVANHGVEQRMGWLAGLAALPDRETFYDPGETLVCHQRPEGV